MKKHIRQLARNIGIILVFSIFISVGGYFALRVAQNAAGQQNTFVGPPPTCSGGGQCQGALGVDSLSNIGVGTGATTTARLYVYATGTAYSLTASGTINLLHGAYRFPDGTTQTTAAANTATLTAANISSGNFGSNTGGGNYSFPADVGIGGAPVSMTGNRVFTITAPAGGQVSGEAFTDASASAKARTFGAVENVDYTWHATSNAWLNPGVQWNRDDVSKASWATLMGYNDAYTIFHAPAAANPISWTQFFTINSSGNVGIGTTAPQYKFQVHQGTDQNFVTYGPYNFADGIMLQSINDAATAIKGFEIRGSAVRLTDSTGYFILTGGNVGIGVASPGYRLDVAGASGGWTAYLHNTSAAGSSYGLIVDAGGNATDGSFAVRDRAGGSYYMYVRGDGNVGIGTSGPNYKLEVNGGTYNSMLGVTASDATGPGVTINNTIASGHKYDILSAGASASPGVGGFGIYDETVGAYRITIGSTGNTGIGMNVPPATSKLAVAGVIESTTGGVKFPDGTTQTTAFAGGSSQTIAAANVSSGTFGANTGGGNYTFPANIYPNNQSTYGWFSNDIRVDTLSTGITNDPLEINYRVAGPVKICASVNCATYSALFGTDASTLLNGAATIAGNLTLSDQTLVIGSGASYLQQYSGNNSTTGSAYRFSNGTLLGYVYGDSSGLGLLSNSGNWAFRVGMGTTNTEAFGGLWVDGSLNGAGSPVAANSYSIQGGSIGASTVYGYSAICTGNNYGDCSNNGGVVLGLANTGATINLPNSGAATFNNGSIYVNNGTAKIWLGNSGASNYLESGNTAWNASSDFSLCGYNCNNMANLNLYANTIFHNGSMTQAAGVYMYPGYLSGYGTGTNTQYYLAGNTTWGLYTNTSFNGQGVYDSGNRVYSASNPVPAPTVLGTVATIAGYSPTNNAIRMTPNLHLNSMPGAAVILNWDNGTTGATQTLRVGNGSSADAFYVRADGYVWTSGTYNGLGTGLTGTASGLTVGSATNATNASNVTGGSLSGNLVAANYGIGSVGVYSATNIEAIWAMGSAYVLPANGATQTTANGVYALVYSYEPDYGGAGNNPGAITGLGHQIRWVANNSTQTAIGSGIWTNGSITAVGTMYQRGGYTVCDSSNNCGYLASGGTATLANGVNQHPNRTDAAWYQVTWNNSAAGDTNLYSSANVTLLSSGYGAIGFNASSWYIQGNATYGLYSNTGFDAAGGLWDTGNRVYSAGNPQVNISGNAATATTATNFNNGSSYSAAGILYAPTSFRTSDGGTIQDGNQFYCNNAASCYFNYSGTGATYIGASGSGTVYVGNGTGKLTVGTIDPVYTIGGTQYATYLPGMTGQKEETTGNISCAAKRGSCTSTLDFDELQKGSDLWLFAAATQVNKNFDRLTVLLTPSFDGRVWYTRDNDAHKLVIHASVNNIMSTDGNLEVSYRLTAPRFDSAKWSNYADPGEGEGFNLDKLLK